MSKSFVVSSYIDKPDIILLEYLLSVLEKNSSNQWKLASDMLGDIVVIDIDEQDGQELYTQADEKDSGAVVIALSSDSPKAKAKYNLKKPLNSVAFMALAKEIIDHHPEIGQPILNPGQLEPTSSTLAKEPNRANNTQNNSVIKRPSHRRLYNLISEIKNTYQNPIEISYQEFSVTIDFQSNSFFYSKKLILLSILCKSNIEKLTLRDLSQKELNRLEIKIKSRPLTELIWCAVLLGSSGELNESINENAKLHLKKWPDLDSLIHLPRHITLSAFMTKNVATLADISKQTLVSVDNVVDFINACHVLELVEITSSEMYDAASIEDLADNTAENQKHNDSNASEHLQDQLKNNKILIIDDSAIARTAAATPLREQGYEIIEAKDGFDALGKLEKDMPDLIILDLIMPGIDGYKVVDLLKKNKKFKHLPIIMVTSKDSLMDKVKGKMSPTDAYLTKPFKDDLLVETIHNTLRNAT